MAEHKLDGYIIPRTDEYQGEYVPACAERLKWLTGFSGSAGVAIVLMDKAVVMSDGRYTIQLKQQGDESCYLLDDNTKTPPETWLLENGSEEAVIGYDPKLFTPVQIEKIQSTLKENKITLRSVSENIVDAVWLDRPVPPMGKVEEFSVSIAGLDRWEKVDLLLAEMEKQNVDACLITLSDSIAWLLNIRGNDIPHIPVALSYLLLTADGKLHWFIEEQKLDKALLQSMGPAVIRHDPQILEVYLQKLGQRGLKVWIDPRRSAQWFHQLVELSGGQIFEGKDPCIDIRAQKTQAEQSAMKAAHVRDGVAVTRFLHWLETTNEAQDELSVEAKLESFRKEFPEWRDSSFDTIAGFGANGAIVHYRASPDTCKKLEEGGLLLLDSGAQYQDGTTDITRTMAIGTPTEEMLKAYTLVLKGHIAIATACFKPGTLGKEIDLLARGPLREHGMDYAHGTGHGVGCYLSVHEEAASLSPRGEEAPKPGMILSNEPGYYKEGKFGIRIESLVLVKEFGEELGFETITLAPLDKTLIDLNLLSDDEVRWVDEYHREVYEKLSPLLPSEILDWFTEQTSPLRKA